MQANHNAELFPHNFIGCLLKVRTENWSLTGPTLWGLSCSHICNINIYCLKMVVPVNIIVAQTCSK